MAGAEKLIAAAPARATQVPATLRWNAREIERREKDIARLQVVEQMRETTSILK